MAPHNWWMKGGYFLVSDYRVSWGGSQPPDEGVMYWGYDEPRGRFKTYFFNDQGPYDIDLSSYEGEVVDNRLVFTGPARFSHALDHDGNVAINPDGSIDVEWFLRNAAGDWMPWRSHRYTLLTERSPGTLSGQRSTKVKQSDDKLLGSW